MGAVMTVLGDWHDDGFQRGTRDLDAVVHNGRLWAVNDAMRPETPLTISDDGTIIGWGEGVSFSPDEGEIDRVRAELVASNPLRIWRTRRGRTLREAATELGMTIGGYGDIERGTRHAGGVPLLHRLAAAAVEAGLKPIGED